jgi:hypothetical protein
MFSRGKVGRSDPCPCGSGQTFEDCCLERERAVREVEDRYGRAYERLAPRLVDYVNESLEEDPLPRALEEWLLGQVQLMPDGPIPEDPYTGTAFFDWFLFNWVPDEAAGPGLERGRIWPIARAFAEEHPDELAPDARACLEAHVDRTWGFWGVVDVSGHFLAFENIFSSERVSVLDEEAVEVLTPGSIVYAAFARFEDTWFMSPADHVVPPLCLPHLVQLRDELSEGRGVLTPAECKEQEDVLRGVYLEILTDVVDPEASAEEGEDEQMSDERTTVDLAALGQQLRAHYDRWLDESIPALDGQSPREAVRSPGGRERVEALLKDFEETLGQDPRFAPDVGELRRKLGLTD